jgi:predicted transcriptional regulator
LGTLDEKDRMMESKEIIKEELTELLENFYDGSFAELVCDYICHTGMTQQEVKELMEVIRKEKGA